MHKLKLAGRRGQAASLDLAVFVAITVIVLSYIFIQSIKYGSSEAYINENENINEIAIHSISALAQSSGEDLELKTIQPITITPINTSFSEDVRTLMRYSTNSLDALFLAEKQLSSDSYTTISKDPHLYYLKSRAEDINYYLSESKFVALDIVDSWLNLSLSDNDLLSNASDKLSSFFSGYSDISSGFENVSGDNILDELLATIAGAQDKTNELIETIQYSIDNVDSIPKEELETYLHDLRCELETLDEKTKSVLTYLETGLDTKVSFLELWPVDAKVEGMTLKEILGDSVTIGDKFIFTDDMRSVAAMAALFYLRDRDMGTDIFDFNLSDLGNRTLVGDLSYDEKINLLPRLPLESYSNTSASGPFDTFYFGVETYLTSSGKLAVRLKFWGDFLGGVKQKTQYFESSGYILNTTSYLSSEHQRTYNGSYVKGLATENLITKTENTYNYSSNLSDEISVEYLVHEILLKRPIVTSPYLVYENISWSAKDYFFDIEHRVLETDSDYKINLSPKDFEYNQSDASKSLVLGMLQTSRGSLYDMLSEAIENRLDDLLEGYQYKFEARDCCKAIIEINPDSEPTKTVGFANYYFAADGARGQMRLTVWR